MNNRLEIGNKRSLELYLDEIKNYQPLDPKQEIILAELAKKGDLKAINKLITHNLRFVVAVAKKFQGQGLPFEDLINEGNLGLIKAVDKYDETRGFRFISYAVWWITQGIRQAIQKTGSGIEIYSNDREKIDASCVISSVPLNALKNIHLDIPSINNRKIEAINSVGYSKVHMVYFKIKRPFWEYDELPNSMWTDSDIGRVFAVPGDNNEPAYLKTWATGSASGKLDSMSSSEVMAYVNKKIIEIRPALKDNIEPVFSWSWQNEVTAGGTYVAWLPGQIRKYSSSISQPNPPLFFAGEYTAKLDRGMEGAMESGERVANEVAKYLGAI